MALDNTSVLGHINNSPRARVIRHLQEWMKDGRLVAGSRLPAEMYLARKFNVSRTTIRLALADLNTQGLIQSGNRKWLVRENINPGRTLLSNCIAVILGGAHDSPLDYTRNLHHPWHIAYIQSGALAAIRKTGYDAFVAHPDTVSGEAIQRVIAQRPRGAIILSHSTREDLSDSLGKALQEGNIPFVIYGDLGLEADNANASFLREVDSVASDHEAGSYALTKWLIDQGRRRILRLWAFHEERPRKPHYWLHQRDIGHERAMKEAGLTPMPAVEIYDAHSPKFGLTKETFDFGTFTTAGYLLPYLKGAEPIDAIMTTCDDVIGQVSAALKLHGKVPNRDVLLVGYDNMWEDLEEIHQWESVGPIATIDKRNMEIGAQLMSLLQERIEGKLFASGERRVVTPNLIIRAQTASSPVAPTAANGHL